MFDSFASSSPTNIAGSVTEDLTFLRGDVREYSAVENAIEDTDAVIHLAAITGAASTHEREAETFGVNQDGTANVLRAANKSEVENVVLASSCNNYDRASRTDISEETPQTPINPYAESKVAAEKLLFDLMDEYGINGTALRMSTNYE